MTKLYFPKISFFIFFIIGIIPISSAQYYWVGDGGDWTDAAHHWATSSGGATFHSDPPTNSDDVFFDEHSFTQENQTVILDGYAKTHNLTWSTNHSPTFFSQSTLYIKGNVIFQNDVTYDLNTITFFVDSPVSITSNGAYLGDNSAIRFTGDGTLNLEDDINAKQFNIGGHTFNTNNHNINLDGYFIIENGLGNLNLGSSTISCSTWRVQNATYNLDAGTSTISPTTFEDKLENINRIQYNKLVFQNYGIIRTAANAKDVSINITENNAWFKFYGDSKLICESLTANTDKLHPLELGLFSGTGFGTIEQTSGTVNLNFVSMQDIHAAGGATFNATGTDNGNNDGWNFSPIPADNYYWVGDTGEWEDASHWATTSGGAEKYTTPPTVYDNVFFDQNSFSITEQEVTFANDASIHDLICAGVQFLPKLLKVNGTFTITGDVNIEGMETKVSNFKVVTSHSASLKLGESNRNLNVILEGGTFNIDADFKCANFYFKNGILNCNNHAFELYSNFGLEGSSTINLGSANITARSIRIIHNFGDVLINSGTSTIACRQYFIGGNQNFNHVILDKDVVVYGNNSFNTLEFAAGVEAKLDTGKIQTVLGDIIFNGASGDNVHISSTVTGLTSTIYKATGIVIGNYLILQDNIATGGATFTANQSIDLGNNTGWNITELMPRDFYWVGNGGNWSDADHWVTTSGGNTLHNDIPGLLDDVYFDEHSFSSGDQTVSVAGDISINTLDWSGSTNNPSFTGTTLNIYKDLIFDQAVSSLFKNYNILGNNNHILDLENATSNNPTIKISTVGITELQSDLSTHAINFDQGVFNTNDHDIFVSKFTTFTSDRKKELNLGTSIFESKNFNWSPNGDSLYINGTSATINCESKFLLNTYQAGEQIIDIKIQHFHFGNTESIGEIKAKFYADTFSIEAGKEISITPDSDFSVGELIVKGTVDKPIKIHSKEENVAATIKKISGIVDGQHLELKDLIGTGGASFHADNSTNLGNVSGWNFSPVFTKYIQNISKIEITPNPVVEKLFIEIPNAKSGIYKIYNAQGKLITTIGFTNLSKLEINVTNLEMGIYIILVEAENNLFKGKFLKK